MARQAKAHTYLDLGLPETPSGEHGITIKARNSWDGPAPQRGWHR
jgi:hypothetical protein